MSNFNPATIWPSQVLSSYKKLGDDMFVVNWDKPKTYGDTHPVKTFGKLVKIINDKGETELRPVSLEVVNVATNGWVPGSFDDTNSSKKEGKKSKSKSKKGSDDDNDGDYSPKLPFVRSTTFERPDEDGKMVTEPLGEACWILRKGFMKAIETQIKLTKSDKDKYGGFWNGPRKVMEPFKLYRKYNKDAGDKKKDIVEIDEEDMIAYEDPIFKVNIDVNKKTNYVSAYIVDVSKIRRKGKEFTAPEAEYQHDKLTKQTVGKFISKGSLCSGIITFDTIKSHSFGISQPFEIGWKKLNEDEKGKRVLYVKRRAASGLATKMSKEQAMMAMLAGQVPEGSDGEESDDGDVKKKRDAAKKAALAEMEDDESTENADDSEDSDNSTKKSKTPKNKVSDDSEDSDQGSSGKKSDQKQNDSDEESENSNQKSKKKQVDSDDEESEESGKKKDKKSKKKQVDSDDEESEESGKKSKKDKKSKKKQVDSDDEESEESDKKKKDKKSKKKQADSDDEESDDSGKKSKKDKKDKHKKNKKQVDSDVEDEIDGIETDSE